MTSEQFRKLLGPEAQSLPEAEIKRIHAHAIRLADAIFELWRCNRELGLEDSPSKVA